MRKNQHRGAEKVVGKGHHTSIESNREIERSNWLANRFGIPPIGSTMVNQFGLCWDVRGHLAVPTNDTIARWRSGAVLPEEDLHPLLDPQNFSQLLQEFISAIDRCTTKHFAIVDTMPHLKRPGVVPGGNYIDTACHPELNLIFLDASRASETIIAHEFGHAWLQYVEELEDYRVVADATKPVIARQVGFIQSFVLDIKVNAVIRKKGFDMTVIEDDQLTSVRHLAAATALGYKAQNPSEEVFMALLIASQLLEENSTHHRSSIVIQDSILPIKAYSPHLFNLSLAFADIIRLRSLNSLEGITQAIDELLVCSFQHCNYDFDLDRDLVQVRQEEPSTDKFPEWLTPLKPQSKCQVGRHMAKNDIETHRSHRLLQGYSGRAVVEFDGADSNSSRSKIVLGESFGPPSNRDHLSETMAELQFRNLQSREASNKVAVIAQAPVVPHPFIGASQSVGRRLDLCNSLKANNSSNPNYINRGLRTYLAGYGRFLTSARLQEQVEGEHPYGYALSSPAMVTDATGLSPGRDLLTCIREWEKLGYSRRSACRRCKAAQGYKGGFRCGSQSDHGSPVPGWEGPPVGGPLIGPICAMTPEFPYGNLLDPGEAACEAMCMGAKPSKIYEWFQKKQCKLICTKLRQGGCSYLYSYCERLCIGQKHACESCMSAWNAAGCPAAEVL